MRPVDLIPDCIKRIWMKPRPRKRLTKIMPLEIQEVFHPDENAMRQNRKGFPRYRRWKPPPSTAQRSHPMDIAHRLSSNEATKNIPAPSSIKKKASQSLIPPFSIHWVWGV